MTDERGPEDPEEESEPTPPQSFEPTPPQSFEPTPPPGMSTEEHDEAAVLEGAGDFTSGEGLVAFAGIVIIAVWVIFDVIIDNYGMDNTVAVLAATAAILPRLDRMTVEKVLPLPILMKVVGYALVMFGVVELVLDLRFGVLDDLGTVVAALGTYAAYVMAFVGARQIEI